jgi:beta-ribofuranosylaminobenzene 5'-phosphate synthase
MDAIMVTAFPRIHFGLLDLAHATQRKYGGVGVVLDWPAYEIRVSASDQLEFAGFMALDAIAGDDIQAVAKSFLAGNRLKSCRIELCRPPLQHVGLGSKTALTLAVLTGVNECFSLGRTVADLQRASGRGSVSGVGVHGFFLGGLIVDAGQPQDGLSHAPSSAASPTSASLLQLRTAMDESWVFYLLLPAGMRYSGLEERELFTRLTPIPPAEAHEAISLVYHGIVPSLLTKDLGSLRAAFRRFSAIGFKAKEIAAQTDETRLLLQDVQALESCAAGMSSVGPLVYAVSNRDRDVVEKEVRAACLKSGATVLSICSARNSGCSIRRDAL